MKNKKITENVNIKIILAGILFTIAIFALAMKITGFPKNMNAKKETKVLEKETYRGIEFSDFKMNTNDGYTTITAKVTNKTNKEIKKEQYYIDLLDKNDKLVITMLVNVPDGLKPKETKEISTMAKGTLDRAVTKIIKNKKE